MNRLLRIILVVACLAGGFTVRASHLAGGGITYSYLGDSLFFHRYRVTLTIYEDCLNGQPSAIAEDNPAYIAVYNGNNTLLRVDSVFYNASISVPVSVNSPCGSIPVPGSCLLKKTFVENIAIQFDTTGYTLVYQRCCLNANVVNVSAPSSDGLTFAATIPRRNVSNNAAVFRNDPPFAAQINVPFSFDLSAVDADGDSLSYEFSPLLAGAMDNNAKPFPPGPPPFNTAAYLAPYDFWDPLSSSPQITCNPVTGQLTATPDKTGLYWINVSCHEWRNGLLIGTVHEAFELMVLPAVGPGTYKPFAGADAVVTVGDTYQFSASGASVYHWSPATFLDSPDISDPVGIFTEAGNFTYILTGITDSGCTGYDTVVVHVLSHSGYIVPGAFTPNGDNRNDILIPVPVGNSTLQGFRIFNRKGNLVFSMDNNSRVAGWDGRYHSVPQDVGSYYWELEFNDNNGKSHLIKGNTILIR